MILKEAYRHQNNLDSLILIARTLLLTKPSFTCTTTQEHLRKKANPDAENETIIVKPETEYDFKANDVIDLLVSLVSEKEKLTKAIADAKRNANIDVDSELAMNKVRQNFVEMLKGIEGFRPSERTIQGTAYKFNVNNEQVAYKYDIDEKKTINFDRNDVRKLIKKYSDISDTASNNVELALLTINVDYVPKYDIGMNLEDAVRL